MRSGQAAERLVLAAGRECSVLALSIDMLTEKSEMVMEKIVTPMLTEMYRCARRQGLADEVTELANGQLDELKRHLPPGVRAECLCIGTRPEFVRQSVISHFHVEGEAPKIKIVRPSGLDAISNLRDAQPPRGVKQLALNDFPCLRGVSQELEDSTDDEQLARCHVLLHDDNTRCRTLAYEICSSQLNGGHFTHVHRVTTISMLESMRKDLKEASEERPIRAPAHPRHRPPVEEDQGHIQEP